MRGEFWLGSLKERDYFEYLSVDGRIILKYTLKKQDRRVQVAGCFEYGHRPPDSIK
jgi:hypothetical protein